MGDLKWSVGALFLVAILVQVSSYCPRYWLRRGNTNFCYRFNEYTLRRNWQNSRLNCQRAVGDLVFTQSMGESNWLETEILKRNRTLGVRQWWSGLKKNQQTQVWEWADGSPLNENFITWAPGQPVNVTNKNCGKITLDGLIAENCNPAQSYICRRKVDTPAPCPYGWELVDNVCYKYKDTARPWNQARADCVADNGDLISATVYNLNQMVEDFARYHRNDMWVGLRSQKVNGVTSWMWADGTVSTAGNTKWVDNQPNFPDGQSNNTCGQALRNGNQNKLYSATPCGQNKAYVCQRPVGTCDDGWRNHEGSCYRHYTSGRTFNGATNFCAARGAKLITIKSSTEQEFIATWSSVLHDQGVWFTWIGLSAEVGAPFTWSDGSILRGVDFNAWAEGEPERIGGFKDCAIIFTGNKLAKWSASHKCEQFRSFFCKIPEGVAVIEPTSPPVPYYCAEGWQLLNGQCYQFNDTEKSWPLARLDCKGQGGDLAVIKDADVNTFVKDNMERDHWVGLHMRNNIGNFTWLDEDVIPTYWNWAPGEPNNANSEEACVEVWAGENYKGMWNDLRCSRPQPFLCQKPAFVSGVTNPTPTTQGGWTDKCGPNWEDHLGTPWCYQFHQEFVDWQDAQDTCRDFGGDLASIMDPEEQAYLHARTVGETSVLGYWIGLNVRGDGGTWAWSDGSPLPYFNWVEGWPNVRDNKQCSVYMLASNGWEMTTCNDRVGYMCKKRGDVMEATTPAPATVTPQPGFEYRCLAGWQEFNGACYLVQNDAARTWNEARQFCVRKNSDLASIRDPQENNFVFAAAAQTIGENNGNVWIGLQDYRGRDFYEWSDHSPVTYTNWERSEPNNHRGRMERCGDLRLTNGKWNDNICENNIGYMKGFVCRKPTEVLAVITEPPSPTTPRGCPWGTQFDYQGSCYMINKTQSLSFDDAQAACKEWAPTANLASIMNQFQQAYITVRLQRQSGTHWIGFSNRGNSDRSWSWVSGYRYSDDLYTHWDDTFTGNEQNRCSSMRTGDTRLGLWVPGPCNSKRDFVCEVAREGFSTPVPTEPPACEEGWTEFNAMCFKAGFVEGQVSDRLVWSDAVANCRLQNADLASIHNIRQNNIILSNVPNDGGKYWIGLHNNTGELQWSDGRGVDFTRWKDGQPDSHRGQENCATYDFGGSGEWEYQNCDVSANWICRRMKRRGPPTGVPPQPTPEPCAADKFVQKGFIGQGMSCDCQDVDTTYSLTLDQCKTHTCLVGGTAFNYKASEQGCYAKKCIGGDLELTDSRGGDDIYALDGPSCDEDGWKYYNGFCWYVSGEKEGAVTAFQGRQMCFDKGGDLASIHTLDENAVLTNIVSRSTNRMVWIGLNRLDLGAWKWTDDTPDNFINWARGEPNDHHYGQLCTNLYGFSGFWNDDNCADPNGFVCKKTKGTVTPKTTQPTPVVPGYCPVGFTGIGNKCFKIFGKDDRDERKTWEDSVDACRALGQWYDLASISSSMEQAIVNIVVDGIDQNTWIGLSTKVGGEKQWVDNSDLSWENWAPGEPNGANECVELYYGRLLGMWNDHGCDNIRAYLCQYRKHNENIIQSTANPFPMPCSKPGYQKYLGECYRVMETPRNWEVARDSCRDDGGDLVSIHSVQENSFVEYYVRENRGSIWTGLNDKEVVGSFGWSNGWFVNYTRWGGGQPITDDDKRCVAIEDDGKWRVTSCSESYASVCKLILHPAPSTPKPVPGTCPLGRWTPFYQSCYMSEVTLTDTFANAELQCGNMGGTLASVHDLLENYYIKGKMIDEGVNHDIWLGMIRPMGNTDGWRWTDGSPVEFFHWAPGEPSDATGELENCVEMWQDSGMWNDVRCDATNKWVCKTGKDLNTSPPTLVPTLPTGSNPASSRVPTPRSTTPNRPWTGGSTRIPTGGTGLPRSTIGQPSRPGVPMSNGTKAGIAIGVVAGALVVALVLLVVAKRRNRVPEALQNVVDDHGGFVNKLYFSSESRSDTEFQPAAELNSSG